MNRRRVLASVPIGMLVPGCVENIASLGATATPTAVTQRGTGQFTVTVVSVRQHHRTATPRPTVSGSFDCTAKTATIDGWLSTSSCRTVAIREVRDDGTADRLTVELFDRWDQTVEPEEVDCAGVTYNYRLRVKAREGLPGELRIVHRSHREEPPERFTVTNDDC